MNSLDEATIETTDGGTAEALAMQSTDEVTVEACYAGNWLLLCMSLMCAR